MTNNDPTITGQVVKTGDKITYTITLENDGTVDATDLVIRNAIPEYTKFVSAQDNGNYSEEKNYITWKIPELKAGESTTVTFVVEVTADNQNETVEMIEEGFVWGWEYEKEIFESSFSISYLLGTFCCC